MRRKRLETLLTVSCAAMALAHALAGAAWATPGGGPAPGAARPSAGDPDAVGEDVLTVGRRWLGGDAAARRSLEAMAKAGRADAAELLGEVLGPGGPAAVRDQVAACGWFARSAVQRRDGLHNQALCAELGIGGPPDLARAAQLYGQAAARGYPKSMCALGNLYVAGRGVPQDPARGAALCRQGAELGQADAQTDLGNLYLHGDGVPHDMAQARHWYELAAAQGQANAQFVLGQIYWKGDGVAADPGKAIQLAKSAYADGRSDAAGLVAAWTFSRWMAAHPRDDLTGLDDAITWQDAAVKAAHDDKDRAEAENLLKLLRAARQAAGKTPAR